MSRDLPKNITKTKSGFHVRMSINNEYHAKHFVEADFESREEALKAAKEKREEFAKIKEKEGKPRPTEYETRFLYEEPDNSTGIIGVFYKEDESERTGKVYPYFCTTVVAEKGRPQSYGRSINRWGKAEALIQVCCIRKRKMVEVYGDRFDSKRFDQSVMDHMKEHHMSYRDHALERLKKCEEVG